MDRLQRGLMLSLQFSFKETLLTPPLDQKWEFCLTLISRSEMFKKLIRESK